MIYKKCRVDAGPNAPVVDPHRGRELALIRTANKPLAYVGGELIPADDHSYRVAMWHRAYSMHRRGLLSARVAHVRCGFLLGYTKHQIRLFLNRGEPLR